MLEIVSSGFPFLFPFFSLYFSMHSWPEYIYMTETKTMTILKYVRIHEREIKNENIIVN